MRENQHPVKKKKTSRLESNLEPSLLAVKVIKVPNKMALVKDCKTLQTLLPNELYIADYYNGTTGDYQNLLAVSLKSI